MSSPDWRLCVAPMIDVTDRHCRYFHRLLAPRARLYTEMITTGALLHGDVARHLDFDAAEHPVALQLGGSEPDALAQAARLGRQWGYDEINLNCGCPSERVQRGAFGACLMAEPGLVADCMKAMQDAVDIPVTVKHRLGLDYDESYGFVRDFVGQIYDTGCRVFVVHARNAVLKGLSPKDNREIPPLRYDVARQLKRDFPDCVIVLNGGLADAQAAQAVAGEFDGVMLGRAAWHTPRVLSEVSLQWWPAIRLPSDAQVVDAMMQYAATQIARGVPLRVMTRPLLGLVNGQAGARRWRRLLSDPVRLAANDPSLLYEAWRSLQGAPRERDACADPLPAV
ncbi:tRNA dihydrouridine(20/20a) synthase DusA [Bordetella bronchiseptica]|uniref:tRNA dihydrouridine(20/20a) synthase DusA n=1 Tax=Bordetella bronchiseptica TaxID=518 RepID=UPI00028B814F|nr:tRNA dihydrouridine(20/20a) synthase DusA [Bordetella bronchiseptica]KDD58867.1 dihydrouridine synthase [Bordetella bronchiseptica OSU553]AUL16154.1 tRNA dihydrouridine(20/20a) synthase DusA [Bordetella bronchiseptica]AWP59310.1 tRNA dihydrouridine(20/20a) synthase DusA [Bordetella bronchiseptica]AWQ06023.1 tRNA dihydrouridine(20/20a) synthase DusA [Bordetella bronchiseptica]AZW31615.1 tRNA dihydrouridine(20/20a) synthase DusA [Bordetella bronchiseptica]